MHISADNVEIPKGKITEYLLVRKAKNDKSEFLLKLGYSTQNWMELESDIKKLVEENEPYLQSHSPFGDLYEVKGTLRNLEVVTIWLLTVSRDKFKFITLFPNNKRERK